MAVPAGPPILYYSVLSLHGGQRFPRPADVPEIYCQSPDGRQLTQSSRIATPHELGIYSGAITVLEVAGGARLYFSILVFVVPAFILLARSALAQSVSPPPPDARAAVAEPRKEPFRAHMAFLADDLPDPPTTT
jgi:hypothetical protein